MYYVICDFAGRSNILYTPTRVVRCFLINVIKKNKKSRLIYACIGTKTINESVENDRPRCFRRAEKSR